ncbi:MAG: S1C family serine protease [Acidimicrobiales bacterium]
MRRSFGVKGVAARLPLISKGVPTGRTSTGVPIASISSVEAGPSVIKTISELCAASVRITSVRHGVAATGAGLVIRPNGMIITTSRLVDGAKSITISTPAGVLSRATLVGSDASSDVAVIKATRTTIKFHTLPDLTNARAQAHVGELTIAVAPGSHRKENVAFGVVKSIGHHARIASGPPLLDSIRTDAPLKNGAQGGALINGAGQLIGMIASSGKTKSGLQTTSIPARLALGVANELAISGHVVHGWLGIEATDANPATTVASGSTTVASGSTTGAKVTAVEPSSSAQRAGIRPGDIISTLDGQTIVSMAELRSDLYLLPPYTRVVLGILRAGESGPLLVSTVLAPNPA